MLLSVILWDTWPVPLQRELIMWQQLGVWGLVGVQVSGDSSQDWSIVFKVLMTSIVLTFKTTDLNLLFKGTVKFKLVPILYQCSK